MVLKTRPKVSSQSQKRPKKKKTKKKEELREKVPFEIKEPDNLDPDPPPLSRISKAAGA